MPNPPDAHVRAFLRNIADDPTRRLCEAARETVLRAVPHAVERLRPGWQLIGYDAPKYFAFIAVTRGQVRLGFEWGVMLTDPTQLLQGAGSQVRHVVLGSVADATADELIALVRRAAEIVPPGRLPNSARAPRGST